ncbi:MAG: hypothetical protein LBL09_02255 [Oscillospiraceae bacterium]|nr:hypothetical protein [Oscillospiraceae bacterium]
MDISKSIGFLLENAGAVIQYRLRKEILGNLSKTEEANLLEQIYQTPRFKLVQGYVKPNGYIGSGMHSWSNWRGEVLHETPLQDGEAAARLLAYFAIPKTHPIVVNYVSAMRDEDILKQEFSSIPPEIPRYDNRFVGLNNGNCLMALLFTMQALLSCGDDTDELRNFQQICLKGFERVLEMPDISDITKTRKSKAKYAYPYIESDEYFPCSYTLTMLAHTQSWRTPETIKMMTDALNHINKIMRPDNNIHVRIGDNYYGPFFALSRPLRSFNAEIVDTILYRRPLTEIAMLGVGDTVGIIEESISNLKEAISADGILHIAFESAYQKRTFFESAKWSGAYTDVFLEDDYKRKNALECDLTFWAVQFLNNLGSLFI